VRGKKALLFVVWLFLFLLVMDIFIFIQVRKIKRDIIRIERQINAVLVSYE